MKFVSVTDEGSKRFISFTKAVHAADKLQAVLVETLFPNATSDELHLTPTTIIRFVCIKRCYSYKEEEICTMLSQKKKL